MRNKTTEANGISHGGIKHMYFVQEAGDPNDIIYRAAIRKIYWSTHRMPENPKGII